MKEITGQVIYMGPHVRNLGLGYGTIFRDGIFPHMQAAIEQCPAMGELFIPVDQVALVRKELHFDIAHQMRGHHGKYVTFYREVQKWIATNTKDKKQPPRGGITLEQN